MASLGTARYLQRETERLARKRLRKQQAMACADCWPQVNSQSHLNLLAFLNRYPDLRLAEYSHEAPGPEGANASLTWRRGGYWVRLTFSRSDGTAVRDEDDQNLGRRTVYFAYVGPGTDGMTRSGQMKIGGGLSRTGRQCGGIISRIENAGLRSVWVTEGDNE